MFCNKIFILRYLRNFRSLNKIKKIVVINRYQSVYSFESRLRYSDLFSIYEINGIIGKCASERKQICQSSLLKPIAGGKKPLAHRLCASAGKTSGLFVFDSPRNYSRPQSLLSLIAGVALARGKAGSNSLDTV